MIEVNGLAVNIFVQYRDRVRKYSQKYQHILSTSCIHDHPDHMK